jgi:hypothetical protein
MRNKIIPIRIIVTDALNAEEIRFIVVGMAAGGSSPA